MSFQFTVEAESAARIKTLDFDSTSLPRERIDACDLCAGGVFEVISWIDRFGFDERFVLCKTCGLVFLNPRPTAEGYSVFYQKYYRPLVSAYHGVEITAASMLPEQGRYAEQVCKFMASGGFLRPGGRAVDFGGSTGQLAAALKKYRIDCLVVDPSPDELRQAEQRGLETEVGLLENWEARGRRFDLAFLCRTVDHLLSVRGALARIAGALNPGGLLFVDVVDFETLARENREYRRYLKLDHCFYLSDRTMRAYFAAAGFEVVASDMTQPEWAYLCRSTGQARPAETGDHAAEMTALLRARLVGRPPRYPVDLLTRLGRAAKAAMKR